jgi:hypothetical protein
MGVGVFLPTRTQNLRKLKKTQEDSRKLKKNPNETRKKTLEFQEIFRISRKL